MTLSDITAHRHQHGFRWQHKPWTTTWLLVATQNKDINTDTGCTRTRDSDLTLRGRMDHERQYGLMWLQRPFISIWPPEAAKHKDITKAPVSCADWICPHGFELHYDLGQHHGPHTTTWPLTASWTMVVLWGGVIQKVNHYSSWAFTVTQNLQLRGVFGGWVWNYSIVQAGHEFIILLPQSPNNWNDRPASPGLGILAFWQ